jgi:DNA topoisomerase-2
VKKYASPEEILVDYLEIRLALYKTRKAYLIKELRKQVTSETLRARFITEVSSGRLVVFQRSRADIESDMTRLGFPHELLVSVRTYQYTAEEINKTVKHIHELQAELAALEATTVSNLWKQDLESL